MNHATRFIAHMKTKPHETRHRFTIALSGGITAVIALFWIVASAASGTFSIDNKSTAIASSNASQASSTSGLAGVAAGLFVPQDQTPSLSVVQSDAPAPAVPATAPADQSVIPF